ncbi:MAG: penicillin-binding transpeptidase domain-containing protein, partial [Terracidiphilus sp.]
ASDGHMVRPHVVFPDQLKPDFQKEIHQNFPGTGSAYVPISTDTWMTITNAMAQVTEPGPFHTAVSAHLNGIDLAGKTGTAQTISDSALKSLGLKGRTTIPNVWFVGVVPRRNPELVVVVLYMHGEFSYYAARIASRVVAAYVDKQRRLDRNLPMEEAKQPRQPVDVGAVWSTPGPNGTHPMRAGHFFVDAGQSGPEELWQGTSSRTVEPASRVKPESQHSLPPPSAGASELGTIIPKTIWKAP